MSYRKTGNVSYNQRRQVMQRFREEWSKGLPAALTKAAQMEKDGWKIDTTRTLMAVQAKERVNELGANGFDSELISIAIWDGEDVVLLAAKAKKLASPVSASTTPTPSTQTSASVKVIRFIAAFDKGLSDGGVVSSKDHAVTFIVNGANPVGSDANPRLWLQMADGIKKNIQYFASVNRLPLFMEELEKSKTAGKGMILFDERGDSAIDVDLLLPALKVFSPDTEVKLYVNQVGIAMLEDGDGDRILVAPNYAIKFKTDENTVDVRKLVLESRSGPVRSSPLGAQIP